MSISSISTAPSHYRTGPSERIDSPMGEVIPIVTRAQVEAAWESYRVKAVEVVDNPRLLCDREYNQELAKLYAHWRQIYLQTEHSG